MVLAATRANWNATRNRRTFGNTKAMGNNDSDRWREAGGGEEGVEEEGKGETQKKRRNGEYGVRIDAGKSRTL